MSRIGLTLYFSSLCFMIIISSPGLVSLYLQMGCRPKSKNEQIMIYLIYHILFSSSTRFFSYDSLPSSMVLHFTTYTLWVKAGIQSIRPLRATKKKWKIIIWYHSTTVLVIYFEYSNAFHTYLVVIITRSGCNT